MADSHDCVAARSQLLPIRVLTVGMAPDTGGDSRNVRGGSEFMSGARQLVAGFLAADGFAVELAEGDLLIAERRTPTASLDRRLLWVPDQPSRRHVRQRGGDAGGDWPPSQCRRRKQRSF